LTEDNKILIQNMIAAMLEWYNLSVLCFEFKLY